MIQSVSFQNIHTLPANERVVHGADGYRTAGSGSLLNRAVNWLKEALFPGIVKRENIAAYEAARRDWAAQNGSETAEVTRLFDEGIGSGARFTGLASAPLRQMSGRDNEAVVFSDLKGLVAPSTPPSPFAPGGSEKPFADALGLDFPRATYTLNGELLVNRGVYQPDGSDVSSSRPDEWAGKLGTKLYDGLPSHLVMSVSNVANQNAAAGIFKLLCSPETPIVGPGGERIPLFALPPHTMRFDMVREGDNAVRVGVRLTIQQKDELTEAPFDQIGPGSRIDAYFDFVVSGDGGGPVQVSDISPLNLNADIRGVVRPG